MPSNLATGIDVAYSERTDLIVFALTGRTGSGCSTAAELLSREFSAIPVADSDYELPERRKISIAKEFAQVQWKPFKTISISSVIFSFLLEEAPTSIDLLLQEARASTQEKDSVKKILKALLEEPDASSLVASLSGRSSGTNGIWNFFTQKIETAAKLVKAELGTKYSTFFQKLGDNIRLSGSASSTAIEPEKLFTLMQRVKKILLAARDSDRQGGISSTRVVIDAVRNPLELVFLRDHFAGLCVIAITVEDETRKLRLVHDGLKMKDISVIDEKEYGKNGKKKHLEDYGSFVSQNLMDCMQKADIFVENPGKPDEKEVAIRRMSSQLIRYVALSLRPGLVTPTRDERCMQVAFVSKLNSGCISRQVGAAIADEGHSIQAIGWNDVPRGQVPCLLRDVDALIGGQESSDFSDYEQNTKELKAVLTKNFGGRQSLKKETGLRCPYCFKSAYNELMEDNNQVHTRSLHAEENAFLQVAKRGGAVGRGYLYTTASPCELCSKKAFQQGIQEIIYVDPYPGISAMHVLASGQKDLRPRLRLFSGAVGSAYHRLYEAILPIKDEYKGRLSGEMQKALDL